MNLVRITAYIRPHRLDDAKTALADLGATGMSIADVRGKGNGNNPVTMFGGTQLAMDLVPRAELMLVVPEDLKEVMIEAIILHAKTGQEGDGKIFVEPIFDAFRVRTGERGPNAV